MLSRVQGSGAGAGAPGEGARQWDPARGQCRCSARGGGERQEGTPVLVLLAGAVCSAEQGAVDLIVLTVSQLIGYA